MPSCLSILRRVLCLFAAVAVLAAVAPCQTQNSMPRAKRHESRRTIDQMEDAWCKAELTSDAAALDTLLADDYMAILTNGILQSREQALDAVRNGSTHITSLELSDRKVRFYGTTAVVTSRAEVQGHTMGGELNGSYRYTRVYVRDSHGNWKIVNFEANRIRNPEERTEVSRRDR